ncbi:hypothetical protein NMA58_08250 [Rhizobium sp. YTUHZ045]|uniref:hypothetical protein n=1 Tax=Rhizobium sp. YTUHZ045 TaxID=2962888 RepID=UPI003DA9D9F2
MTLKPVSFSRPVVHEPRISKPYIPGKHDKRFWTDAENDIIREHFPNGGAAACLARLGEHRTLLGLYNQAKKLGIKSNRMTAARRRHRSSPELDAQIREEWQKLDAGKKGVVNDLADRLGLPRWWLTKRLTHLGLTTRHKKEPPWTAAEDELMKRAPLHMPDKAAKMFREHGFIRSPTAIVVRAKRLNLSRRAAREELSATKAGNILGVDIKFITGRILAGELPATKREDKRRAQQGGSAWDVKPSDLRKWILDNIDQVDLRKVDKVPFIMLIAEDPDREQPPS